MLDGYVADFRQRWGQTWYIQWLDASGEQVGYVTLVHRRTGQAYDFELDHEGDGYHLVTGGALHGWIDHATWWKRRQRSLQRAIVDLLTTAALTIDLDPQTRNAIDRARWSLANG